jgi:hypothetical protein
VSGTIEKLEQLIEITVDRKTNALLTEVLNLLVELRQEVMFWKDKAESGQYGRRQGV